MAITSIVRSIAGLALFVAPHSSLAAPTLQKKYSVIIDPGHGGLDTGASHGDLKESVIVLAVSQEVAKNLRQVRNLKVLLTRNSDKSLSLGERSKLASGKNADLFVSIHANSSLSPKARGTEFYFRSQLPPDEEAMFLANRENQEVDTQTLGSTETDDSDQEGFTETVPNSDLDAILLDLKRTRSTHQSFSLAKELARAWQNQNPQSRVSIKQGPFHVLFQALSPAVLVELGYLTNAAESQNLRDPKYQSRLAKAISQGIENFIETMDKSDIPSHIPVNANRW